MFLPTAKAFPGMGTRGAAMLRVDLDAAGIPYTDKYGRQRDFHSLRHTFASLLNQANVPLATAQKLMRHSDPKLTANIYTHVMVNTKAEALARLPVITSTLRQSDAAERTGTDDAFPFEWDKTRDRKMDSFGTDSHGQIKTCTDSKKSENRMLNRSAETENPPVPQGEMVGGERGIRTPGSLRSSGFQDHRLRPLGHLSDIRQCNSSHTKPLANGRGIPPRPRFTPTSPCLSPPAIRISGSSPASPSLSRPTDGSLSPLRPNRA